MLTTLTMGKIYLELDIAWNYANLFVQNVKTIRWNNEFKLELDISKMKIHAKYLHAAE